MRFDQSEVNQVTYFGLALVIPKHIQYVATDSDGTINGYSLRPKCDEHTGYYRISDLADLEDYVTGFIRLGHLPIAEGNWEDSCISIKQLLWEKLRT